MLIQTNENWKVKLKKLKNYLSKHSNDVKVLVNCGHALYGLNRNEEAIEMYDRALRIHPTNEAAINNKGQALNKLKKYPEAMKCFDIALTINKNCDHALNNKGL